MFRVESAHLSGWGTLLERVGLDVRPAFGYALRVNLRRPVSLYPCRRFQPYSRLQTLLQIQP